MCEYTIMNTYVQNQVMVTRHGFNNSMSKLTTTNIYVLT